jgi:MFS family permease
MALIRIHVPADRRPTAFGRMSAVMAGAAALGPALGGVLIDTFGWHSVFLANLPILAVSWLLQRSIKLSPLRSPATHARPAGFDWIGSVLLTVGLVAGMIGVRVPGTMTAGLLILAVIFLAAFVFWELRVSAPVLDLRLFARPLFAAGSLIVATQNLAMYALVFQMPFLFRDLSDLPQSVVGLAMLALTAGMVVFAPLGGRVATYIGARLTVVIGGLTSTVGVALLADLEIWQSATEVFFRLGLIGLGLGLSAGPTQASAMGAVHQHESGMAAAAVSTSRYFGGIAGIAILSSLMPDTGLGEAVTGHLTAFWIFVASFAVSVLLALALPGKVSPAAS